MKFITAQDFISELSEAEFKDGNIYYAGIGLKENSESMKFSEGDCFIEVGAYPCEIERLKDSDKFKGLFQSQDLKIVPSEPLRMSQDPSRFISDLDTAGVCNLFFQDPLNKKAHIGITCAHTIPTGAPAAINFSLWLNSKINFASTVLLKYAYGQNAEDFATLNIPSLPGGLTAQNVSSESPVGNDIVNHFGRSTDIGRIERVGVRCTYDGHSFRQMVSIKHMDVMPGDSGSPVHFTNSKDDVLGLIVAENSQYTFANQIAKFTAIPKGTQLYYLRK